MQMSSTQKCEDILSMKCDEKLECIWPGNPFWTLIAFPFVVVILCVVMQASKAKQVEEEDSGTHEERHPKRPQKDLNEAS